MQCRGYSSPLQRALTDFGSDCSFAGAVKKVEEHYGVKVPPTTTRLITEKHAENIHKNLDSIQVNSKPFNAPATIITQTDGSMIPIVKIDNQAQGDKRKTRKTEWREARLALARPHGSTSPFYGAIIGSVDEAGKKVSDVVEAAGRGEKTHIHGVGDGALWIADQFDKQFGRDGNYTIDFFHLSEYLAEAALCIDKANSKEWLHAQQALMKENKANDVLIKLTNHINECEKEKNICGASKCHQYMEKRMDQFNYKDALAQGLPIGSGEIESGHRSIIQKRVKTPGGWWLERNAQNMISLRVVRANGFWGNYWEKQSSYGQGASSYA